MVNTIYTTMYCILKQILGLLAVFIFTFNQFEVTGANLIFIKKAFPLPQSIWSVESIDFQNGSHNDLIAVGETKVWAIETGKGQTRELADTPGGKTIHSIALDADGDGDMDLALGRSASHWIEYREGNLQEEPVGEDWTVAWLENTGNQAPWPLHPLDRELNGVHGLWKGDVNNDGKVDLIADSFAGPHLESSLAWFPAPFELEYAIGSRRKMITKGKATGRPHYMFFGDMDNDHRGDVLLGASSEGSFTWWKQPKHLNQEWSRQLIAMEPGATHPRAVDLNHDGRLDVLCSAGHGTGIMWFEAPDWKKHVIDISIRDVHAFDASDLDGDGDVDAAGCSFSDREVRWWENLGDGTFDIRTIDTGKDQEAYDLKIKDLDQDGLPDILLAGRRSNNAVFYQNKGPLKNSKK